MPTNMPLPGFSPIGTSHPLLGPPVKRSGILRFEADKDKDNKPPNDKPPSLFDQLFNQALETVRTVVQQAPAVLEQVVKDPKKAFRENVEDRLVYHPIKGPFTKDILTDKALAARIQDIYFTTADGVKLHAWYIPAQPGKETCVFAHGNAGNISHREFLLQTFTNPDSAANAGFGIFAFDYRGFGNSEGTPSEDGFYKDFDAASKYVENTLKVPRSQQIAVGESIGSAVAIHAAANAPADDPYRLLFVYAAFTSLPAVAPSLLKQFPGLTNISEQYLPGLVQQQFDSKSKIGKVTCPVLLAHGEQDELVPFKMKKELMDAATSASAKDEIDIDGGDHNNIIFNAKDFVSEINKLLAKTQPQPAQP